MCGGGKGQDFFLWITPKKMKTHNRTHIKLNFTFKKIKRISHLEELNISLSNSKKLLLKQTQM
jgi:hypothetical protein